MCSHLLDGSLLCCEEQIRSARLSGAVKEGRNHQKQRQTKHAPQIRASELCPQLLFPIAQTHNCCICNLTNSILSSNEQPLWHTVGSVVFPPLHESHIGVVFAPLTWLLASHCVFCFLLLVRARSYSTVF